MTGALLFGYSVEESDDKFVITLAGKLAVPIMQDMGAAIGAHSRGANRIAGLLPYSLIASYAVGLRGQVAADQQQNGEAGLADIFGQGFDRDLDEFDRHLERYRALLPTPAIVDHGVGSSPSRLEVEPEEKNKSRSTVAKS